jgi:hypothetical protein
MTCKIESASLPILNRDGAIAAGMRRESLFPVILKAAKNRCTNASLTENLPPPARGISGHGARGGR